MNTRYFGCYFGRSLLGGWIAWFRIFDVGLQAKTTEQLYGERYGRTKPFLTVGRVRFFLLTRTTYRGWV